MEHLVEGIGAFFIRYPSIAPLEVPPDLAVVWIVIAGVPPLAGCTVGVVAIHSCNGGGCTEAEEESEGAESLFGQNAQFHLPPLTRITWSPHSPTPPLIPLRPLLPIQNTAPQGWGTVLHELPMAHGAVEQQEWATKLDEWKNAWDRSAKARVGMEESGTMLDEWAKGFHRRWEKVVRENGGYERAWKAKA
ncbi:hypothetical protein BD779DRAFT_1803869 [Infundibulicybe gibba]|nr:hypothetical protein BD779DRAFT_1803869 [Infundibulicybe gibba]